MTGAGSKQAKVLPLSRRPNSQRLPLVRELEAAANRHHPLVDYRWLQARRKRAWARDELFNSPQPCQTDAKEGEQVMYED
jgi:hypothetical protein